jgi:hypothetical protein
MPAPGKVIIARIATPYSHKDRDVVIVLSDHPNYLEGTVENMETMWHGANEGYHVVILPALPTESEKPR